MYTTFKTIINKYIVLFYYYTHSKRLKQNILFIIYLVLNFDILLYGKGLRNLYILRLKLLDLNIVYYLLLLLLYAFKKNKRKYLIHNIFRVEF